MNRGIIGVVVALIVVLIIAGGSWYTVDQTERGVLLRNGAVIGTAQPGLGFKVPLFLFYGLAKGAFLATEAASSLGLYFSKSVTFERLGALNADIALKGLIAGASLMFGAFIAKRFVLHLKPDAFRLIMDGIMLAAGASLLWTALTT